MHKKSLDLEGHYVLDYVSARNYSCTTLNYQIQELNLLVTVDTIGKELLQSTFSSLEFWDQSPNRTD